MIDSNASYQYNRSKQQIITSKKINHERQIHHPADIDSRKNASRNKRCTISRLTIAALQLGVQHRSQIKPPYGVAFCL